MRPCRPATFSSSIVRSFMILVISFLYHWCRRHWNNFRCYATLQFKRRFNNLVYLYFPPTHFFREKLLLKKGTVLCDKHFAFGSVIEGIPNSSLGYPMKTHFSALGSSLSGINFLT